MHKSIALKGRTAIITGATRGIGRAIALQLASEGANIAFNYITSEEAAGALRRDIESLGVKAFSCRADIRSFDEIQSLKDEVLKEFGTFDILVNNAGIVKDGALAMLRVEDWHSVIDTNLNGVFNVTKAAILTFMKQKRGDIVNISSVSGIKGIARQTNYASSKGAILAFTRSLAREVASFNIRVNAIAPGFIETDMLVGLKQEYLKKMVEAVPLRRLGRPEEIGAIVSFLLNEKSSYITGQVIQVDGGMSI